MIILFFFCLSGLGYSLEKEDATSNYLCEYGIKLYRKGDIDDAIHELKKALQINPYNEKAQDYLRRITGQAKSPTAVIPTITNKKYGRLEIICPLKTCINDSTVFYAQAEGDDNNIYEWDFGDGSSDKGKKITKSYTQAGTYKIKLTQYDSTPLRQRRPSATKLITVYSPPIAEAGQDTTACVGQKVILDGTQSRATNSIERFFKYNPLTYIWDFGDGTPKTKGAKVKHIYHNPDRYKVTLKVIDGKARKCADSEDSVFITVYDYPDIVIRETTLGCPERQINFSAFRIARSLERASRKDLKYTWDFGDGTIEEGEADIPHTYRKGGEYLVKVIADDQQGTKCSQSSNTLKVKINHPPEPAFTFPEKICTEQEAIFDASATQDNTPEELTYRWNFGDGTYAEGKQVKKVFSSGGIYKVTLSVNDHTGTPCNINTISKTVKVSTPAAIGKYKDIDVCIPRGRNYYKVTFDFIGGSDKKKKNRLFYYWDFGDGTNAQGKNVAHIYQKEGQYTVKLKVDDGSGLPCSFSYGTVNVNLNKQPFIDAGGDIITCIGNTVTFDATGSATKNKTPLAYTWDFGDGSTKAQGARVNYSYKKSGIYQVKLIADDGKNTKCSVASDTLNVYVNSGPNIAISKIASGCAGKPINFNASKTTDPDGDYLKFTWDFGDGTITEGRSNITHTYEKGAEYLIKVTADDQRNSSCSKSSATLKIKINTPPVANSGPNPVCCTNVESVFNGSNSYDLDGDPLAYYWDFGDGSTSKEAQTTHIYTKKGDYKVTLKVDDNSGTPCNSSTSSFTASVHEKSLYQ